MSIEEIKKICQVSDNIIISRHAFERFRQRGISTDDVIRALSNGEIIEDYPDDYPYPSCLVLGTSLNERKIHTVCSIADNNLWIITAYFPSKDEWEDDFKEIVK